MAPEVVRRKGKRYVLVPEAEYRRLVATPKVPELPKPDAQGNYPAAQYLLASIARDIVQERTALGLSQQELADLAGVRQETICRIETGRHSPTVRTVEKIERALKRFASQRKAR
jgi:ribosome-binding protein aMBF1 (putative translation factor)